VLFRVLGHGLERRLLRDEGRVLLQALGRGLLRGKDRELLQVRGHGPCKGKGFPQPSGGWRVKDDIQYVVASRHGTTILPWGWQTGDRHGGCFRTSS
jgi:class 3 adenylate cyclase